MSDKDYATTIKTGVSPSETFDKISQVSQWWAKDFEGESKDVGDVFTVRFSSGDMYKVKVGETIPNKKVIWEVIDAFQGWVKNPTEWVGTTMVWDINEKNGGSEVYFSHLGLGPQLECFGKCTAGWDYLMQKSLSELLNTGKGLPV